MNLCREQQRVFAMIQRGESVAVLGCAGSGKSYLIKCLVEHLPQRKIVLGTTGTAAVNVGGETMHSFFCMYEKSDMKAGYKIGCGYARSTSPGRAQKARFIRGLELIIIDEVSMMRPDQLVFISDFLAGVRGVSRSMKDETPFGGITMAVVGDFMQLQAIFPKGMERTYLFDSPTWKHFTPYVLKTNHRQRGDDVFYRILNEVRVNKLSAETIALLEGQVGAELPPSSVGPVSLVAQNKKMQLENYDAFCAALNGEQPTVFWGSIDLEYHDVQDLGESKAAYNVRRSMELKSAATDLWKRLGTTQRIDLCVGAQVMMTANVSVSSGWCNGTVGVIESFCPLTGNPIMKRTDGITMSIEPYKVSKEKDLALRNWSGSVTQYPLILAYAFTIHKSQGQTFHQGIRLAIDDQLWFAPNVYYVALSRAPSLFMVSLIKFDPSYIHIDETALKYCTLVERAQDARDAQEAPLKRIRDDTDDSPTEPSAKRTEV
jgi:ATP-dependent DNA helicase PIF1